MLEDFRDLEKTYSLRSYPYADSSNSQQRLRALGIATDQLIVSPEPEPVPVPAPTPKKEEKIFGHLPLLLGALLIYLFIKTS